MLCIQPCSSPWHLLLNPVTSPPALSIQLSRSTPRALQNCTENSMGRGQSKDKVHISPREAPDSPAKSWPFRFCIKSWQYSHSPTFIVLFQCLQVQRIERRYIQCLISYLSIHPHPSSGGVLLHSSQMSYSHLLFLLKSSTYIEPFILIAYCRFCKETKETLGQRRPRKSEAGHSFL